MNYHRLNNYLNSTKLGNRVAIISLVASIFLSTLLAQAIILALIDQFKTPLVYFAFLSSLILAIFFSIHSKKDITILPSITIPAIFLIFLVSLLLIFYPHDTFGGRDEALYSNLAVYLTKSGSLKIPSYLDHLPDDFAENVRTYPPGYTAWLAIQKVFFGTQGILRGNVILSIFGLASLFLVSSHLGGKKIGLITIVLFSSSMPFLWFSRETMSENLSFFLLWSLILFLFTFLKTKRNIYLVGLFMGTWLFALTRFEGFLIQFVILLILPFLLYTLKVAPLKRIVCIMSIYLLLVASNLLIAKNTFGPSLKMIVPIISSGIKNDISSFLPDTVQENFIKSSPPNEKETLPHNYIVFFAKMLAKYNFLLIISSIFLVTGYFLIRLRKPTKTKLYFLTILAIILPEFYKIVSPNVTIDQPWLYRRYMYALLPFGYLCLFLLLDQLKNKRFLVIVSNTLLIINVALSSQLLFVKNNWLLVDKMEEITKDISKNDFVIIENWTLRYYYPASFLILQKGVRSAFTSTLKPSQFLPEKKLFNGVPYEKFFLLSTQDKKNYPSFIIAKKDSMDVEYTQLIPSCQLNFLGEEEGLAKPSDVGKLTLSSVEKYCRQPKNEIVKYKGKLYLYELIYENKKD